MLLSLFKSFFSREPHQQVRLHELEDSELMIRYAQGDDRAFTLLFERHKRPLYTYILRSCGRPDIADELLQDVFLRVINSASNYKPSAKFTTWLYRIARNACIDAARKRSRAQVYSLQNSAAGDDSGDSFQDRLVDDDARSGDIDADRKAFRDRLQRALEKLPEEQREVFLLREISGLTFREVAQIMDAPLPTIKSRMRYALEALRRELAEFRDHSFDAEEQLEMIR